MINLRIDTLLEHVDSKYASVLVAARRARQINSYYHNLGEGTFDEFPPPMVESGSQKYLTIALEGGGPGKIKYHHPSPPRAQHGGADWPGSSPASPAGSPPTRRSRSCAWPRRPATPCASSRRRPPSG